MSAKPPTPPDARDTLSVRLGRWFEANGTGKGVLVIPVLLALLVLAAALTRLLD